MATEPTDAYARVARLATPDTPDRHPPASRYTLDMPKITFDVDPEGLAEIERLQARLGSPNLATAIFNAVSLIQQLYAYQDADYAIQIVKGGNAHRFKLPAG